LPTSTSSRKFPARLTRIGSSTNTGTTTLRYLELWQSDHFADVSLRQWLAFTPHELVKAHLNIDKSVLAQIPTHKTPVVPA
jgi:oxalate decarboxylase